jgi:hypothetical protein
MDARRDRRSIPRHNIRCGCHNLAPAAAREDYLLPSGLCGPGGVERRGVGPEGPLPRPPLGVR